MRRSAIVTAALLFVSVAAGWAASSPEATISNGQLRVKMYLPDPQNGFYKGVRFDWSGIINSVEFAGHTFYGQWFSKIDPTVRDVSYKDDDILVSVNTSAMGPAEEFQTPLGYDNAKEGDSFVKIGVGVLKKRDDTRYAFANVYDIVDHGKWTVNNTANSVEFTQELNDKATGYGYVYQKTIRLTADKPEMVIQHSLKNTGKLPIKSVLYNHNFTLFDHLPTGDITVTVPYEIKSTRPPDAKDAVISGHQFAYARALENTDRVAGGLQGFAATASDYDFRIENHKAGTGIRIQGNRPLQNASVWSIRSVVAVEPFIEIDADPGKEFTWQYTYAFYTLSK
jgi:hypothetical protein